MRNIILLAICLQFTLSCELPTFFGPPADWKYEEPIDTVVIPIDTTVIDTIPTDTITEPLDTITPCEDYDLILSPPFVTLWLEFDTEIDSIWWQGGGVESYDLNDVLQALTSYPTTIYNKGTKWAIGKYYC